MDGAKIHMAVNSLLECSVCLQVLQDPRNLPCGHTFCLQCIEKTCYRFCALCKRKWSLPENGLQELPKNFVAASFTASLLSSAANNAEISDINESDFELNNGRRALLCAQHKDKAIEFFCTKCDVFCCQTCYVSSHTIHKCISVEEADENLLLQLEDSKRKVQTSIKLSEDKLKKLKLSKERLENEGSELLEVVKTQIINVKAKLQVECVKIVRDIDACYEKVTERIVEKMNGDEKELEKSLLTTTTKLHNLRDAMYSLLKLTLPSSSAVERASFLKDNSVTQLIDKLEITNYQPNYQFLDINQWKTDMDDWLQSLMMMISNVAGLPQINSKDVMTRSRYVCFYTTAF